MASSENLEHIEGLQVQALNLGGKRLRLDLSYMRGAIEKAQKVERVEALKKQGYVIKECDAIFFFLCWSS